MKRTDQMTIIDIAAQEIAQAGDEGLKFNDIMAIQRKHGKAKTEASICGAAGSIVARLQRRRKIYVDRSTRPYVYKISKTNGSQEPDGRVQRYVIPGGFMAALDRCHRTFKESLEHLIEVEVKRRVRLAIRDIAENVSNNAYGK